MWRVDNAETFTVLVLIILCTIIVAVNFIGDCVLFYILFYQQQGNGEGGAVEVIIPGAGGE